MRVTLAKSRRSYFPVDNGKYADFRYECVRLKCRKAVMEHRGDKRGETSGEFEWGFIEVFYMFALCYCFVLLFENLVVLATLECAPLLVFFFLFCFVL